MKELEKKMRILSELVAYCYSLGAEEYSIRLRRTDNCTIIEVTAAVRGVDEHTVNRLSRLLNVPRQHEVEQMYWELSGDSEDISELTLTGMMTDRVDVELNDGNMLTIRVYRYD